jgi:Fic family protein
MILSAVAYRPPFEVTPRVVASVAAIERLLGRFEGLQRPAPTPKLRRNLAVRTVQATLAIEGEAISREQITAMLDGKRVRGTPRELLAAKNAVAAYERAASFRPEREADLLRAHGLLMTGLIPDAGRYRKGNVGVVAGSRIAHVAPQAKRVATLVQQLLSFVRDDRDTHPIVKSALVHYELEFIHPFSDGNGRIGRLWQHVMLTRFDQAFNHVPVETVVRERQADYYNALASSDRSGTATPFVELSLETIHTALQTFLVELRPVRPSAAERLERARSHFGRGTFSRQDYIVLMQPISTATASRDLALAVREGLATREGDKATATYRFTRR